jgi:hypothetical protein
VTLVLIVAQVCALRVLHRYVGCLFCQALYSGPAESLTGLSTVRAYGEQVLSSCNHGILDLIAERNLQARFVRNADQGLDLENRAYYMYLVLCFGLSL